MESEEGKTKLKDAVDNAAGTNATENRADESTLAVKEELTNVSGVNTINENPGATSRRSSASIDDDECKRAKRRKADNDHLRKDDYSHKKDELGVKKDDYVLKSRFETGKSIFGSGSSPKLSTTVGVSTASTLSMNSTAMATTVGGTSSSSTAAAAAAVTTTTTAATAVVSAATMQTTTPEILENEDCTKCADSPGPKVPPLKIVIPPIESEQNNRSGKIATRHHGGLPYVVVSNDETGTTSSTSPSSPATNQGPLVKDEESSTITLSNEEQRLQQRVLRSTHSNRASVSNTGNANNVTNSFSSSSSGSGNSIHKNSNNDSGTNSSSNNNSNILNNNNEDDDDDNNSNNKNHHTNSANDNDFLASDGSNNSSNNTNHNVGGNGDNNSNNVGASINSVGNGGVRDGGAGFNSNNGSNVTSINAGNSSNNNNSNSVTVSVAAVTSSTTSTIGVVASTTISGVSNAKTSFANGGNSSSSTSSSSSSSISSSSTSNGGGGGAGADAAAGGGGGGGGGGGSSSNSSSSNSSSSSSSGSGSGSGSSSNSNSTTTNDSSSAGVSHVNESNNDTTNGDNASSNASRSGNDDNIGVIGAGVNADQSSSGNNSETSGNSSPMTLGMSPSHDLSTGGGGGSVFGKEDGNNAAKKNSAKIDSGNAIMATTTVKIKTESNSKTKNDAEDDSSSSSGGGGGTSGKSGNNFEMRSDAHNKDAAAAAVVPVVELHPRKRKLKSKQEIIHATTEADHTLSFGSAPHPHEVPVTNCYQMYMDIRRQIDIKRKGLFPIQPKPPQGFKDYLMNRCTYTLAGNSIPRLKRRNAEPPEAIDERLKDLYQEQEAERYSLRMQHVVEKEKLVLSVEQEILRVHGRAARALANQALPFSACTILKDEEVYNVITPEQEEKDRNARSRYNGRLFISWLQDVDDKWEKIKEEMLARHHKEAESLNAVQKFNWDLKMRQFGLCKKKNPTPIDESHVPMISVSDDFDLLPE